MHEGARLIHRRFSERNAEANRHQSHTFFDVFVLFIENFNTFPFFFKIKMLIRCLPCANSFALSDLTIRERITRFEEIFLLNDWGGHANHCRCLRNRRFYYEHPLRSAKTSERSVRWQVSAATICCGFHIRNKIGIGAMKKRSF